MSEPANTQSKIEADPKLRHEFVGMMFAVAIGEVGLQTATLVQAGEPLHFLPAYSHLLLATILIATSWVGWTKSLSRGGQQDVNSIFEREFLILLLDVFLVILYFILVRRVDFVEGERGKVTANASARPEATLILWVFCVYIIWDFVAKFPFSKTEDCARAAPAVVCALLAWITKFLVQDADPPYVLTADFALLMLALFFRSLKDLASSLSSEKPDDAEMPRKTKRAILLSILFLAGWFTGVKSTVSRTLPDYIVKAIPANKSQNLAGSTENSEPQRAVEH